MLSWIGEATRHARQQCLTITPIHAKQGQAKTMLLRASAVLKDWQCPAGQLNLRTGWQLVCDDLIQIFTRFEWCITGLPSPETSS